MFFGTFYLEWGLRPSRQLQQRVCVYKATNHVHPVMLIYYCVREKTWP